MCKYWMLRPPFLVAHRCPVWLSVAVMQINMKKNSSKNKYSFLDNIKENQTEPMDQWTVCRHFPIHIGVFYLFKFFETVRLPINSHFAWIGMFFFWSECPLIVSCGKPFKFDCCLTRVCLMIGKPALQSNPKKRLTRKKENIHSPPITTHRISFYLSPGEHVLKVLCHWNHIGELKTTLCGTPDALTVYPHPVLL